MLLLTTVLAFLCSGVSAWYNVARQPYNQNLTSHNSCNNIQKHCIYSVADFKGVDDWFGFVLPIATGQRKVGCLVPISSSMGV